MSVHKCSTCFYHKMDNNAHPCVGCSGYSNWVHEDTFKEPEPLTKPDFAPLSQSINNWFEQQKAGYKVVDADYNVIDKPKHYMLFENEGIEVRHVISKLVEKIKQSTKVPLWENSALFEADYVQMMQYLMRFMDKNGVEDLKKSRWYLDKMIDSYEHHV